MQETFNTPVHLTTTNATKATYRHCGQCNDWVWTDQPDTVDIFCDECALDQGERVEINVGEGSPAYSNTSHHLARLMQPYRPGDDLLVEIDGRRVYYTANRVFDVRRAAPPSGGF